MGSSCPSKRLTFRSVRARIAALTGPLVVLAVSLHASNAKAIVNGEDLTGGMPGTFTLCRPRVSTDPSPTSSRPFCGTAMQFGHRCVVTASHLVWYQKGNDATNLVKTARIWHGRFSKRDADNRFEFDRTVPGALLLEGKAIVGGKPFGWFDGGAPNYAQGLPEIAIVRVGKVGSTNAFAFPKTALYKTYAIGVSPKRLDKITFYGHGLNLVPATNIRSVRAKAGFEVTDEAFDRSAMGGRSNGGFAIGDTTMGATTKAFPTMFGVGPGDSGGGVIANGKLIGIASYATAFKSSTGKVMGKDVDFAGWGAISNLVYAVYRDLSPNRARNKAEKNRMTALRKQVLSSCGMKESELPNFASAAAARLSAVDESSSCVDYQMQTPFCIAGLESCNDQLSACFGFSLDPTEFFAE